MSNSSAQEQDDMAIGNAGANGEMDDVSSGEESDYGRYWLDWFLNNSGNEFFCEVDDEYMADKFNLTGLYAEVSFFQDALDLIQGTVEDFSDDDYKQDVERNAEKLYGLIHSRYILTNRGLAKMLEKYKRADFGKCPRVYCNNHPLLPVGLSDAPDVRGVKLYCPKCEDVYHPKSARHASIDGAYFGTTFPHMLFQVYPYYLPTKSEEKYVPRIFGFKIHPSAYQQPVQRPTANGEDVPTVP